MRRVKFVLMIIFMLNLSVLPLLSLSSQADEAYPEVKIALTESSKTAKVTPSESASVVFNGLLSVTFPTGYENPAAYINVTLEAVDTWDSAKLSQKYFMITKNGDIVFNVTVTVPPKTSLSDEGIITVAGSWFMEPQGFSGPVKPLQGVNGRIRISQYYNFTISTPKRTIRSEIWRSTEFELQIQNTGNFMDSFTIEIGNYEKLSKNYFNIYCSMTNVELMENGIETIKIYVEARDSMRCLGKHEIIVRVTSDRGFSDGVKPQEITFELEIPQEQIINTEEFQNCLLIVLIIIVILIFIGWRRRLRKRKEVVRLRM